MDEDLIEARKRAASRYAEGSICWRGILGGQWDGGNIVGAALKEVRDEKSSKRESD